MLGPAGGLALTGVLRPTRMLGPAAGLGQDGGLEPNGVLEPVAVLGQAGGLGPVGVVEPTGVLEPATGLGQAGELGPVGVVGPAAGLEQAGGLGQVERGLTCTQCGARGIASMSKLMVHLDRMHSKPFTCIICKVEFVDRFSFNLHSPNCYFFCPIEGCNYKEKRESRLKGHLRRHKMS